MKKAFHGPWIVFAAFITFGLSVGIPYYNISFFYDYFARDFGWSRADITLGFPLAAALTLWIGPLVIHRFSPRKLILIGTALTCVALVGFGKMPGALWIYWGFWVVYTVGYFLSGPPPHQIIVSQWYRRNRGKAMAIVYVGVGLMGSVGSFLVKDLGIDWRWGEKYFAQQLNDFDLAANNGGWQWVSSSGCDAQPYFRIFNPVSQSQKFDAEGKLIRRYLPQLAGLPSKAIHAPWNAKPFELQTAGVTLGQNYPAPIVAHDAARALTLQRYGVVRKMSPAS